MCLRRTQVPLVCRRDFREPRCEGHVSTQPRDALHSSVAIIGTYLVWRRQHDALHIGALKYVTKSGYKMKKPPLFVVGMPRAGTILKSLKDKQYKISFRVYLKNLRESRLPTCGIQGRWRYNTQPLDLANPQDWATWKGPSHLLLGSQQQVKTLYLRNLCEFMILQTFWFPKISTIGFAVNALVALSSQRWIKRTRPLAR